MLGQNEYETNLKIIQNFERLSEDELREYRGWGSLWNRVKDLRDESNLREEVLAKIEQSVLTSYYTEPALIRAIWKLLDNLGFRGGQILDPSCGIGNFFNDMPEKLRGNSTLTGVELEPIAAKIAQVLNGDAKIYNRGFEEFQCGDNVFDLCISNIPFSTSRLHERRYNCLKPNIHEHFLLKMVDLTKEGGLIAVIVSTNFLDKQDGKIRNALEGVVKLVAGWRLAGTMFKKSAGIHIATDLLIFQRGGREKNAKDKPIWVETQPIYKNSSALALFLKSQQEQSIARGGESGETGEIQDIEDDEAGNNGSDTLKINRYFFENPSKILGELFIRSNAHGRNQFDVKVGNIGKVTEYLEKQSISINWEQTGKTKESAGIIPEELQDLEPGTFKKKGGKYWYRFKNVINQIEDERTISKIDKLKEMARIVRAIYKIKSESDIEKANKELGEMQKRFRETRLEFMKRWGSPYGRQNEVLSLDADYYLVKGTEVKGELLPLFKDLRLEVEKADYQGIEDIYNHCLSLHGKLDLAWIQQRTQEWLGEGN